MFDSLSGPLCKLNPDKQCRESIKSDVRLPSQVREFALDGYCDYNALSRTTSGPSPIANPLLLLYLGSSGGFQLRLVEKEICLGMTQTANVWEVAV